MILLQIFSVHGQCPPLLRKLSKRSAWFLFEREKCLFSTYRGAPTAFLSPQSHPHFQAALVSSFQIPKF
jgi:hypothetical protein